MGMSEVSVKLYENARHELLNERNKQEVISDIISWFSEQLEKHKVSI